MAFRVAGVSILLLLGTVCRGDDDDDGMMTFYDDDGGSDVFDPSEDEDNR